MFGVFIIEAYYSVAVDIFLNLSIWYILWSQYYFNYGNLIVFEVIILIYLNLFINWVIVLVRNTFLTRFFSFLWYLRIFFGIVCYLLFFWWHSRINPSNVLIGLIYIDFCISLAVSRCFLFSFFFTFCLEVSFSLQFCLKNSFG